MDNSEKFSMNADLRGKRSKFQMPFKVKTTFNTGELVPLGEPIEVLPGDTISINSSFVIRGNTPIADTMDDAFADIFFFFVPSRITWTHWVNMFGQNDTNAWTQTTEYLVPSNIAAGAIKAGSALNHLGLPIMSSIPAKAFSLLQLRGYAMIWNDFFRDENTQSPCLFNKTETDSWQNTPVSGTNSVLAFGASNSCFKVCRYHGYFGSALPAPQKGNVSSLLNMEYAPLTSGIADFGTSADVSSIGDVRFFDKNKNAVTGSAAFSNGYLGVETATPTGAQLPYTDLVADLSGSVLSNVSELRTAIVIQHVSEALARNGSRYTEFLSGMFGVSDPDSVLQRPEFLGGKHVRITSGQVVNTTSATSSGGQGALGQVGSFSLTSGSGSIFTHSFREFGYIFPLVCIRTNQSYCQGIPKSYQRSSFFDFYQPLLANISEQPIAQNEIFATSANAAISNRLKSVFGYMPAWSELRFKLDNVSGYLAPNADQSIGYWTYCNNFSSAPTLAGYLPETTSNVDNTIQVTSASAGFQWIADFLFDMTAVRRMPIDGKPGLTRI